MALQNGIDTIAIASMGFYSETYGVGEEANVATLYVSFGYLESASIEIAAGHIPSMPTIPSIPVVG